MLIGFLVYFSCHVCPVRSGPWSWNNTATHDTLSTVLDQLLPKKTHGRYLTQCNMERCCCPAGCWHGNRYIQATPCSFPGVFMRQMRCFALQWYALTGSKLAFVLTAAHTLAPGRQEGSCHLAGALCSVSLQDEMNYRKLHIMKLSTALIKPVKSNSCKNEVQNERIYKYDISV